MKWHEIIITTSEEASDAISDMLITNGAAGVAIEDPNDIKKEIEKTTSLDYADEEFMSKLGEDVVIKAYFSGEVNLIELIDLVKQKIEFTAKFLDIGKGTVGSNEVDDEDWATSWKKYYKPVKISENIVIKPTWEEYLPEPKDIVIEMDPGMAFGTGTHETTKMCAMMLEKYQKKTDTVIDIGCGTGILAIIAAKLGSDEILAFDIDEIAVKVTKQNIEINKVEQRINASRAILSEIKPRKFNLAVANIISNVIIDIKPLMHYYLYAGSYFITSGIIKERRQEVIDVYAGNGFELIESIEMGEWVAIVFKCLDSL